MHGFSHSDQLSKSLPLILYAIIRGDLITIVHILMHEFVGVLAHIIRQIIVVKQRITEFALSIES